MNAYVRIGSFCWKVERKIEIFREYYVPFRTHNCLGHLTPEMIIEKKVKTVEFSILEIS